MNETTERSLPWTNVRIEPDKLPILDEACQRLGVSRPYLVGQLIQRHAPHARLETAAPETKEETR